MLAGLSYEKALEKAKAIRKIWGKFKPSDAPGDYVLQSDEFAPLIGTICDQSPIRAEDAWSFPKWLHEKLRSLEPSIIIGIGRGRLKELLRKYLHERGYKENERIKKYIDDVSGWIINSMAYLDGLGKTPITIFEDREHEALEVYFILRKFNGIGPKKAAMIARDFFYRSHDIIKRHFWFDQIKHKNADFKVIGGDKLIMPVDVHVVKVFCRIFGQGYPYPKGRTWHDEIPKYAVDIIAFSMLAFPKLPAKLDDILWSVGREYCSEQAPRCNLCPLRDLCDWASRKK